MRLIGRMTVPSLWRLRVAAVAGLIIVASPLVFAQEKRVATSSASAARADTSVAAPTAKPAIDGVLALFEKNSVVALADEHGSAQEEVFYSALVRDPRFAEQVGNVVVEFGGEAAQDIIDRYVSGETVPPTELRRVWTQTVGWVPGPTSLGYINFFANVRAANMALPPERRIKVWLGEPKIDWSTIHSFEDLAPYMAQRDDNYFRIITDEILAKHKKTLLIIGAGHLFGPAGPSRLSARIDQAYPHALATVTPFVGYIEPDCNAKFVERAKAWPVPAVVGPVKGTWLESELELPGCSYVPSLIAISSDSGTPKKKMSMTMPAPPPGDQSARANQPLGDQPLGNQPLGQAPPPTKQKLGGPGAPPPPIDMAAVNRMLSGVASDAILYLGPPDTLTQSPIDPNIYLDADYFNEEKRRLACCSPFGDTALDWDQLLQQNSVVPRKLKDDAPPAVK